MDKMNYFENQNYQGHNNTSNKPKKNHPRPEDDGAEIYKILKEIRTIEEQIPLLVSEIEAESSYYENVARICSNLSQIMKFFYKEHRVKVCPFGSSLTKLALKGSDADIFLDFRGQLPEPPDQFVRGLRKKICKFRYFHKPMAIFAKVPIVQCIHQSGVDCDVSFLNALGVRNSELIKFLITLDERIRPFFLIIKFLMKKDGLIGPDVITSFSCIILMVFFLQQLENPLIPSISHLQRLASSPDMTAEWDTSFTTDTSVLPTVSNTLSVVELMKAFFEFYSTFEFGFYVISAFTGKTYLKPIFAQTNLLSEEFKWYKKIVKEKGEPYEFQVNKFMCVQGPFNHSRNITWKVSDKILQRFQNFCLNGAKICQEELEKRQNQDYKSKCLLNLLESGQQENRKKIKSDAIYIYVGDSVTSTNYSLENLRESDLVKEWSEHVLNTLKEILIKVMKCRIDVECGNSEFDDNKKFLKCEFHHLGLLSKRKETKHQLQFPENLSAIGQEEMISDFLYETVSKDAPKVLLKFEITFVIQKGPTRVCLDLDTKEEKKNRNLVQSVFHFMQKSFPKLIK